MALSARLASCLATGVAAALIAGCGSEKNIGPVTGSGGVPLLIAFSSDRPPANPGSGDVYFWDGRTEGASFMPPNVNSIFTEGPSGISGNGGWLAYNTTNPLVGTTTEILLYNVATAQVHAPSTPGRFSSPANPSLSYDGRYLAFQSSLGSFLELDITLMDAVADTIVPTPKLHAFGAADFDPSLSGDGKLIAFTTNRNGTGFDIALYSVTLDSILPLPNLNTAYDDIGVSISADGRYLAFHSNRPGGTGLFDVYVYDRNTSSLLPMPGANTALSDFNPALSPDGRYVAFQTEGEGGTDIRLYDLVARQLVKVPGLNDPYFKDTNPSVADAH
jgi:Tol biopolymer transport system component